MTAKKRRAPRTKAAAVDAGVPPTVESKDSGRGLTFTFEPTMTFLSGVVLTGDAARSAYLEKQKALALELAKSIEGGNLILPTEGDEHLFVAAILKSWAEQVGTAKVAKKRGNPAFQRKIPDDDTIPHAVAVLIGYGSTVAAAVATIADQWKVDESVVAKSFRKRRKAIANHYLATNLRRRVGAIRGK